MLFYDSPALRIRFWAKVDRSDPNGCWPWTGAHIPDGYGSFGIPGMPQRGAHRVSLELRLGRLLGRWEYVCHHCDNPPCVNPGHLFISDAKGNRRDAVAKGRVPTGDNHPAHRHPERMARGEQQGSAKLSDVEALEILRRGLAGGITQTALAAEYAVSKHTVSLILLRKSWRHLKP